jgi:26S proteasome regulatory subunit N2
MLIYAHETQHEKIIRGLATGIAMVMYGREEQADTLIEQLLLDKDPILRYGAMYTIGLSYCGTANNSAIKRLLHVAVSDVSDDVRRAAVTALGFVLFKQPEQCPRVVSLLAESYNPHVRYGACLALGISCAGTALKGAIDILEPLASDSVDFVRQGALIGLSMVLIQATKQQEPKVESIRKLIDEKIADKHEDQTCKFGAVIAAGILDAGGRNVTISLSSRSGHKNMSAIVGLAVFSQFWYWYPLTYFVSLAFTPTTFIGLNKDLKMPAFQFKSNVKPSMFAYPPKITPPTTAAPAKVQTAVLSTTRKKKKQDDKKKEAMDIDKPEEVPKEEEKKKEEKKEEKEPDFEIKNNPARVTRAQVKYLSFDISDRYSPVRSSHVSGIVMLHDNKPGQPEELVTAASTTQAAATTTTTSATTSQDNEPAPPEPFQYDPSKA